MTIEEIKNQILCMIRQVYEKEYVGKLFITRLDPIGLEVKLGMNNIERPITIAAEMDDQKFLQFFKQELKNRNLNTVIFFDGVKTDPDQCNLPINRGCKCNEK